MTARPDPSIFKAPALPQVGRAAVLERFGDASQLQVRHVPVRQPGPGEILVRVQATSVNPIEWKMRQGLGLPHFVWRRLLGRPMVLGIDFSGTVAAVGPQVRGFAEGDEVFGATPLRGAYAEYLLVRPGSRRTAIAHKPARLPHHQAALLPFAGLVAYAGLVTHSGRKQLGAGSAVLIIGGSGGVGHLAVQIAKRALGAEYVVAVSSSRNSPFVRACGADEVVEYDRAPVERLAELRPEWNGRFDIIFDTVGDDRWWTKLAPSLLAPKGRFVTAALPPSRPGRAGEDVRGLEGLRLLARMLWRHLGGRYRLIAGLLGDLPSKEGMSMLAKWSEAGSIRPHVAESYELEEIAQAHRSSETGRTAGKIAVLIR